MKPLTWEGHTVNLSAYPAVPGSQAFLISTSLWVRRSTALAHSGEALLLSVKLEAGWAGRISVDKKFWDQSGISEESLGQVRAERFEIYKILIGRIGVKFEAQIHNFLAEILLTWFLQVLFLVYLTSQKINGAVFWEIQVPPFQTPFTS